MRCTRTATVVVNGDDVFEDPLGVAGGLRSPLTAEDLAAHPVIRVRAHRAGRVSHIRSGHEPRIWGEPPVRHLVRRAARRAGRRAARGV